jgi:hypothetical protein
LQFGIEVNPYGLLEATSDNERDPGIAVMNDGNGKYILLVDDEPNVDEIIAETLEQPMNLQRLKGRF